MIRRRARDILALATLLAGCASLPPSRPIDSTASLAGTWRGRMSGFLGNAPVILTIKDDGSYQGILFVEGTKNLDCAVLDPAKRELARV